MSTAFLDSAVEAPRFGYPGVVSLYAMQHTMDVEEEMCFDPAIHCFQGIWKHEDPLFFIHGLRQLMRLATERVARSYGYRVGGVLVDYGTLYRFLVEEAEAWECSEGKLEERRKTSPLDVFAGTIAEADIDHLFVLGSAWLCFKIAQRVHARVGGSRMKPFVMPSAVVCSNGSSVHLFLLDATECGLSNDDLFVRCQCWLQFDIVFQFASSRYNEWWEKRAFFASSPNFTTDNSAGALRIQLQLCRACGVVMDAMLEMEGVTFIDPLLLEPRLNRSQRNMIRLSLTLEQQFFCLRSTSGTRVAAPRTK
ncbi:hypothetical protein C4B63_10g412 [Trypanosoma cruzi]|uniref:Receptor-type adenylate cyclase GRESAG 4.1/3 periplasmic binding protein-like domain-containing protein n=1 Tax=Trypanosoma cruzi TaxID=5693 RepID=A0A2V2VRI5_TRYCR|nr:hypothetical protein C4B63_10g412 [Trypanosoma cruzi]